jgi:hypothetical protein
MNFVLLLIVVGVALAIWFARAKARRLAAALAAYQDSLTRLKEDPTNATLKQRTLALGREYSSLTRDSKGVSLFDEVALSNDINAACAGATRHPQPTSARTMESRLSRLTELQSQGLLSAQEFQEQRARILQEL